MSFTPEEIAAWNYVQAYPSNRSGEPHLVKLHTVNHLRWAVDTLERSTVRDMRRHGWTWQEIGDAYGITHQAARQRWSKQGID